MMADHKKHPTDESKLPISLDELQKSASRNLEKHKKDLREAPKKYKPGEGVEEVPLEKQDDHLG